MFYTDPFIFLWTMPRAFSSSCLTIAIVSPPVQEENETQFNTETNAQTHSQQYTCPYKSTVNVMAACAPTLAPRPPRHQPPITAYTTRPCTYCTPCYNSYAALVLS